MSSEAPDGAAARASAARTGGATIVFDGVCVLCNGWVRFLLRHDRHGRYRFASMQSVSGRALLTAHGLDPDDPSSLLLIEHGQPGVLARASTDTDAVRRVLAGLGGAWRVAHAMALMPRFARDALYVRVARNRYRWFGRRDVCALPTPEQAVRFLD
ncbi:thiol-disulfide oxidoreductase DCC family protein [Montanilutibacter psychrotolerans]|nr:thiol-disulfide oxidoreductase DCC family protein [Lysobacter psychrotolerans]